ncbi:hypothetical protein [Peijinzhouia sedimentorum]
MKKTNISVWLIFFLLLSTQILGQQTKIDVTIHSRVDTTKAEVKEVAELWINYLNSKPDELYDNPYWNQAEKLKYKSFDFSRAYLYQFPSNQLLGYFKPTILSIEKEGDSYGIRTIFSADGLEREYRKSNPWSITKLYAVKENAEWKLKNALPVITENWNRKTIGKITFIFPSDHNFNEELAINASLFCDRITEEFQFPEWDPFDFYITGSGDELGRLLNFDFFFAGYTTGIGMNDNRILLSGLGSEYFPHEFIHLIVPKYERHWIIEEGFATWKGGTMGKTFEESASTLANEIAVNNSITFDDVLNKKWGWQVAAFYTTGAVFCKLAYDKGGVALVKKLLETPNDNEELIQSICSLFEIEQDEINTFWRAEVLKFKSK